MSQRRWSGQDLVTVDALADEVCRQGAYPIVIFFTYGEKQETGSIGIRRLIDEYLVKDGKAVIDVAINTISSSIRNEAKLNSSLPNDLFLERLDIPILQSPMLVKTEENWRESIFGLTTAEIAYDVAFPEFDGQIITVPHSGTERTEQGLIHVPIEERTRAVTEMAIRWGRLRHMCNRDRKVAILFYMYPPDISNGGSAAGLDTFQSIADLLKRMSEEGYSLDWVPKDRTEMAERIMSGITNDTEWVDDKSMIELAAGRIPADMYAKWFSTLCDRERSALVCDWGEPPGDILTCNGEMAVPGIMNGNVFLSFQPARGKDVQATYHNHNCTIPHQYLAFYRWVKEEFGADAVIHVGTHGTLEWLPGKSVGLSGDCACDYVLSQLPNLYIYVICNPGEGIQAKRRSYAVLVDHLIPALGRAGSYDELGELEVAIQSLMKMEADSQKPQLGEAASSLLNLIDKMNMRTDAGLGESPSTKEICDAAGRLYDYIEEVKENIIKDGLHVFGLVPKAERMHEMIYCLTRLPNGEIPSLPRSIAHARGYDLEYLQDNASEIDSRSGKFNAELAEEIAQETMRIISSCTDLSWEESACLSMIRSGYEDRNDLERVIHFICEELYPNLLRTKGEMDSLIHGLEGGYVPPGPSGCPTRGRAQILPTGKNFYGLDPDSIPTQASWKIGVNMADQMIERFVEDNGRYPDSIGIVLWATDTLKTGGDDVAYVLWLMGIRPVWTGTAAAVTGLEVIPREELGRPRIDVTLRISGLFRDAFPNLTEMLDRAVEMVADLDESEEDNHIRANFRRELSELIAKGIPEDDARAKAMSRIFSGAPGQYGAGTNVLIRTSNWEERKEIGDYYIGVGSYRYGIHYNGICDEDTLRRRMARIEVTVKNSTSREYDMIDNDDVFQYLGGFNAAVESVTGRRPMSVIGCSADTTKPVLRTIEEESRFIFHSKVMNPKYERGLREHGFRGATEIKHMFEYVFAWDATSNIIEDWMYDTLAERYLLKEDVREWMEKANPYAVHDMLDILMEAESRGMWKPSGDLMDRLKEIYLENEEFLEEITDRD